MIKSRRMIWAEHVARVENKGGAYSLLMGKPEGRNHLEDAVIDGKIILRWIFRKCESGGIGWIDLAEDRDRWQSVVNALINL
jgi:hypothetical protein